MPEWGMGLKKGNGKRGEDKKNLPGKGGDETREAENAMRRENRIREHRL
jgi:hypothetical protein